MNPTLGSYQRIYMQLRRGRPGYIQAAFSITRPTSGALVALLSRGSILRDGMVFDLASYPTQDPALTGPAGPSAYQVARANGYGGTEAQWLTTLVGATGASAYDLARAGGYGGTQTQWLTTLKGADGVSPVLSIGTVATLTAGAAALATITGTPAAPKINLSIPAGATGPSFTITAPTATVLTTAQKTGAAFQVRTDGPAMVNVLASLSGLLNVAESITVAIAPPLTGTSATQAPAASAYTTVSLLSLTLNAAGTGMSDTASGGFLVPTGWWVKVAAAATLLGTLTAGTIIGSTTVTRVVWNL